MTRILIDKEWYEAVSSTSLYEDEFENIIMARAHLLYPSYFAVPFKKAVQSDFDVAKPDMALIDVRYRCWWVVEIEMAHHSLNQHVLPQARTLAAAKYGEEEASFLSTHEEGLAVDRLLDMMKGTQPRVLVVVNSTVSEWIQPLGRVNAIVQVVEVFRSTMNRHVLRVNGDRPTGIREDVVSTCHLDPIIPRLLVVDSPAGLGVSHGQTAEIEFEGGLTQWERIDSKDNVWLSPRRVNPLNRRDVYRIVRDAAGVLHFEKDVRRRV